MDTRASSTRTTNVRPITPPQAERPSLVAGRSAPLESRAGSVQTERPIESALDVSKALFAHIHGIAIARKYPHRGEGAMQRKLDDLRDACIACAERGAAARKFVVVVKAAGLRVKWTVDGSLDVISIEGWPLQAFAFDRREIVPVNELGNEFEGDGEVGNG